MNDITIKLPPYRVHDIGNIETLSQIYPDSIRDLAIPNIWKKTKGRGIKVAILDTGAPKAHPDLMKHVNESKCRSFITGEDVWDAHVGHGTHVTGTIGALDNAYGIVGIAPEVELISVKVLSKNGRSDSGSLLRGLEYCVQIKPDVINMSLGATTSMPDVHKVIKKLTSMGIPVVAAAGNNGDESIMYPAQYDEVIAVGSYSKTLRRERSDFSSYGDTLDIMGPGEEVMSTYLNGQYAVLSGTSMACPVIVGVIALLLSHLKQEGKTMSVDQIKRLLIENTVDIGDTGYDKHTGWGMINPEGVFAALSGKPPKAFAKLSFWQKFKMLFYR